MNIHYQNQIETEMQIRGLSEQTIECYLSCLKLFMRYFRGRKPQEISLGSIKDYCKVLSNRGQSHRYINMQMSSIRFFYRHVCKPRFVVNQIPYLKEHKKLPVIFSREEVKTMLNSVKNKKHYAMMVVLYGTGIRINELVYLKVADIDSQQKVLFVSQGKGTKQRYVPLSDQILKVLRNYWQTEKPDSTWLFCGLGKNKVSRSDYVSSIFRKVKKTAA